MDYPNINAILNESTNEAHVRVRKDATGGYLADICELNGADQAVTAHDPRTQEPLLGVGKNIVEAWDDLELVCSGKPSGYAAIRARGPFKLYDPNANLKRIAPTAGYRPAYVQDADGVNLFCVSKEGEPTLARYVVEAMNLLRDVTP